MADTVEIPREVLRDVIVAAEHVSGEEEGSDRAFGEEIDTAAEYLT